MGTVIMETAAHGQMCNSPGVGEIRICVRRSDRCLPVSSAVRADGPPTPATALRCPLPYATWAGGGGGHEQPNDGL